MDKRSKVIIVVCIVVIVLAIGIITSVAIVKDAKQKDYSELEFNQDGDTTPDNVVPQQNLTDDEVDNLFNQADFQ